MIFIVKNLVYIFLCVAVAGLMVVYLSHFHSRLILFFRTKCPEVVLKQLNKRRVRKIELQLVDSVEMLANGLKAGLSLQQSFQMLSTDGPSPINEEFALIVGQIKVGKNFEESLIEFKERVSLDDVDILVESILVLRQTGGNLVETFSSIANTIRERQKISGKIRVLTAQGVTQAAIILAMPFALVLGLYFVADWYVLPLITEPLGLFLILVAFCMQGLGAMWLKKIVTIKV